MKKEYTKKEKEHIPRLYHTGNRSVESLVREFGVSTSSVNRWKKEYDPKNKKENIQTNKDYKALQKENEELKKEIEFLKDKEAFLKKAACP